MSDRNTPGAASDTGMNPDMRIATVLKMLAPYFAVSIFWCGLHSGWATLIVYHLQILAWSGRDLWRVGRGWNTRLFLVVALPCAIAGPATFLLLPVMVRVPLPAWLADHGLAGTGLLIMVPYYGLIHPLLEQAHWGPLRAQPGIGPLADLAFAAYHALVLASLLRIPWIAVCVGILAAASAVWRRAASRTDGGLLVPALSHALADAGIVAAALAGCR